MGRHDDDGRGVATHRRRRCGQGSGETKAGDPTRCTLLLAPLPFAARATEAHEQLSTDTAFGGPGRAAGSIAACHWPATVTAAVSVPGRRRPPPCMPQLHAFSPKHDFGDTKFQNESKALAVPVYLLEQFLHMAENAGRDL